VLHHPFFTSTAESKINSPLFLNIKLLENKKKMPSNLTTVIIFIKKTRMWLFFVAIVRHSYYEMLSGVHPRFRERK